MKGIVITVLAALALAAPATAAAPQAKDPRVPALMRQVAALTAKVTAMQNELQRVNDRNECYMGLNTDVENIVWEGLGIVVRFLNGKPQPASPARWDDHGACARVGITRPTG